MEHVIPANLEWRQSPVDKRRAIALAGEISNLVEYHWHETKNASVRSSQAAPTLSNFRKALFEECKSLALMRDIADAHKHLVIDRLDRQLSCTDQITPKSVGYGQAYGLCYGGGELLAVLLDNGRNKYFVVIVDDALAYWSKELSIAGI